MHLMSFVRISFMLLSARFGCEIGTRNKSRKPAMRGAYDMAGAENILGAVRSPFSRKHAPIADRRPAVDPRLMALRDKSRYSRRAWRMIRDRVEQMSAIQNRANG